jgi:hypothetical protein
MPMTKDKKINLLKAAFFLFVAIACLVIMFMGIPGRGRHYPIVGFTLSLFVAVGYVKRAFDKY